MTIPQFAPGCFGSALTYREGDMVCRRCPFAKACGDEHLVAMERLRERLGIVVKPRRKKPVEAKEEIADPSRLALPNKVQKLLERLDKEAFDVVAKLRRGENPFLTTLPFMAVACHLLIKLDGPLSQTLLAAAMVKKLGWKDVTASAHARMALQALEHVGAITLTDGMAVMRRE